MKNEKIIYYSKTNNGFLIFNYNGFVNRYLYYSFNEALKDFRKKAGLAYKHITLIKDNEPITYGYVY